MNTPETEAPGRGVTLGRIITLSLGHGVADFYVTILTPIWPVVARTFLLSQAQVGWVIQIVNAVAHFSQPLLGYATDRHRLRRLTVVATLIAAVFVSTFGYIHSLALLVLWLCIGMVGVALYHPRAGGLTGSISGRRRALGMALFGGGGGLGCAFANWLGPVLYNLHHSLTGLVWAMPVGLAMAGALLIVNPEGADAAVAAPRFSFRREFVPHLSGLLPLFLVMLLRAATTTAFANFVPFLVVGRGLPLTMAGKAGLFFLLGAVGGGMLGSRLSERTGPRGVSVISLLVSIPILYWSLHTGGMLFFLALFVAGATLRGAESVNIAQAQGLLPGGQAMATSLGIGLAWGVGGFITPLVGSLADQHGQVYALTWTLILPALAAAVALWAPKGGVPASERERIPGW